MTLKTLVNAQGKIIEGQVPENWQLKDNQYLVTDYYTVVQTTNGINHTLVKPIWDFVIQRWIEAATAAELLAAYPVQPPVPPSAIEKVEAQATYTAMMTDTLIGGV